MFQNKKIKALKEDIKDLQELTSTQTKNMGKVIEILEMQKQKIEVLESQVSRA